MTPEDGKDPIDVDEAVPQLNRALAGQRRSVLHYTLVSGSLVGFEYHSLAEQLWTFARAELDDLRRLIEKIVVIGGEPTTDVEPFQFDSHPERAVQSLIDAESATIEALQDTIPHTGHTGDSEALEHRLEHMIMRKQEQLDALARARRRHV
jgi:bacterioferritin (cytochrome b1)